MQLNKVAALAEEEGHDPDLHLEGYRQVAVESWTHAAGGLTENDFILAAKINQIPIELNVSQRNPLKNRATNQGDSAGSRDRRNNRRPWPRS